MVHQATQSKKRHRRKKPLQPQTLSKQPTMGLASLRQVHQANTLRRSEECLTTTSPNSSASESEIGGESALASSNQFLDQQPVWTRQTGSYGRGMIINKPEQAIELHSNPKNNKINNIKMSKNY